MPPLNSACIWVEGPHVSIREEGCDFRTMVKRCWGLGLAGHSGLVQTLASRTGPEGHHCAGPNMGAISGPVQSYDLPGVVKAQHRKDTAQFAYNETTFTFSLAPDSAGYLGVVIAKGCSRCE